MAFTYNADSYAVVGYFLAQEESFSATSLSIATGTGDINSMMDLLADGYSVSTSEGDALSTIELLGDGYSVSTSEGDIYSVMGLSVNSYAVAVSHARLSFPSIWQGKLSIIPSHTKYEIRVLT